MIETKNSHTSSLQENEQKCVQEIDRLKRESKIPEDFYQKELATCTRDSTALNNYQEKYIKNYVDVILLDSLMERNNNLSIIRMGFATVSNNIE